MATKGFLFCLTLGYERTALCKANTLSLFLYSLLVQHTYTLAGVVIWNCE
jgi:hypothetical protein